ncbi:MAG: disulfide bond formation protein B [Lysobacterales bacterium]
MSLLRSFRAQFALIALICAALLAYAYYVQYQLFIDPCPLCIMQRVAFLALGIVALLAALHAPRGWGRRVYGLLAVTSAAVGAGIALQHVRLQNLPPDQVPACGPGLGYMFDTLPVTSALRKAFTGSGECAKVDWTFLGLSMPTWTLVCFVALAAWALFAATRRATDVRNLP